MSELHPIFRLSDQPGALLRQDSTALEQAAHELHALHNKAKEAPDHTKRALSVIAIAAMLAIPRAKPPIQTSPEIPPFHQTNVKNYADLYTEERQDYHESTTISPASIELGNFTVTPVSPLDASYPSSREVPLQQLRTQYASEFDDNDDGSITAEAYLRMRYAEDTLAETLQVASSHDDSPVILQRALDFLGHFTKNRSLEKATTLPLDMNDAVLLAHALDSTRDLRDPEAATSIDAALSSGWDILHDNTKHLLEQPHVGTYDPHGTIYDAFERSELNDKPIMEQFELATRIEAMIDKLLEDGDIPSDHQGNISKEIRKQFNIQLHTLYANMEKSHPEIKWGPVDYAGEYERLQHHFLASNK